MKKLFSTAAVLAALLAATLPAHAQTVQAIVPFPPGGPLDSVARVITSKLRQSSSETYVIDNRAGANGNIGAKAAAQAAPDGRTWLFADGALITVNPKLYPKDASFEAQKDLKVVAGVALQPSSPRSSSSMPTRNGRRCRSSLPTASPTTSCTRQAATAPPAT